MLTYFQINFTCFFATVDNVLACYNITKHTSFM